MSRSRFITFAAKEMRTKTTEKVRPKPDRSTATLFDDDN